MFDLVPDFRAGNRYYIESDEAKVRMLVLVFGGCFFYSVGFFRFHKFFRKTKGIGCSRFYLHENQQVAFPGHQINFQPTRPPVPEGNVIAFADQVFFGKFFSPTPNLGFVHRFHVTYQKPPMSWIWNPFGGCR